MGHHPHFSWWKWARPRHGTPPPVVPFNFPLAPPAPVMPPVNLVSPIISSAGVFDYSGKLVRTLWSAQADDPRVTNLRGVWDGALDDGSIAPSGNYSIWLLENNVTYAWEGAIGNSSPDHSVSQSPPPVGIPAASFNYYHSYAGNIWDMTITPGGEMYFTTAYDERLHTYHVSTESNPQRVNTVLGQNFRDSEVGHHACCSDGTNVYFAFQASGKSLVYGIVQSTKLVTVFSAADGVFTDTPEAGYTMYQISTVTDGGDGSNYLADVAVQRSGNILFTSRVVLNRIDTLNKTTGALLHSFTGFTRPTFMDTNPVTGDLWVTHQVDTVVANATWDFTTSSSGVTLSNGDLTALFTASGIYTYSTGTGTKTYFEVVINDPGPVSYGLPIGFASNTTGRGGFSLGFDATSFGFYGNGTYNVNNVHFSGSPTWGIGDNVGIAADSINHLAWIRVNGGLWNGSPAANPATGVGGYATLTVGSPIFAALGFPGSGVGQATAKFAAASWAYAAPAGYSQLPGVLHTTPVSKMTVDGLGNLTNTGVIAGSALQHVLNVAISPDGATLLVVDGGSQQVRAFNTSDGSVKTAWGVAGTLGVAGGYATGPAVTNTKFLFNSFAGASGATVSSFIAYSSNGSFWLGDPGNCRYLHFSAGNSPNYIEQISYLPLFYSCWVCYNDPTRVFGTYLEFKIDYSKPLAPGNGSWTLVNNWFTGAGVFQNYSAMRYTITGTNGRTYVPINGVVYEISSSGYRNTGVSISYDYIDRDFNLWGIAETAPGAAATFMINGFAGFDGSNNPTWTTPPGDPPATVHLTTQVFPPNFPTLSNPGVNNSSNYVEPLANGVIPIYDVIGYHVTTGEEVQYHFGGIDSVTGNCKFAAHPPIPNNNGGVNTFLMYPPAPSFANAVSGAGGNSGVGPDAGGFQTYVPGTADVFTLYRGEGWGQNQTSVWSHWHQCGLLINRTGVAAPYFGVFSSTLTPPAVRLDTIDTIDAGGGLANVATAPTGTYSFMGSPGLSGNAFNGGITLQNGNYYLYNNDEWYHGGVHRWRVGNVDKIRMSSVPVAWNAANFVPKEVTASDFLAALPFSLANLPNGAGGWSRNPTADIGANSSDNPLFRVYTNALTCDRNLAPDLVFEAAGFNALYTASYSWTRSGTGNWTLAGTVFHTNYGNVDRVDPNLYLFFDVLDNTGKKLVRIHNTYYFLRPPGFPPGPRGVTFWANNNPIRPPVVNVEVWTNWIKQLQPLKIVADVSAGTMTVSYAGYTMAGVTPLDVGADLTHPAKFVITYTSNAIYNYRMSVAVIALGFKE